MRRYNSTTRQRLTDIKCKDMKHPVAITVCQQTSHIYLADSDFDGFDAGSIWLVSAVGGDIKHWLPKSPDSTFRPRSLSVTSTRLLVTSHITHQLRQFDADGNELRCVQLQDDMELKHAVESPTGTFIISQYNSELKQGQVTQVNNDGAVLRHFTGSRLLSLGLTPYIAVDSHGNVIVADCDNDCILLLDGQLSLRRVIISRHQLNYEHPYRLCHVEQSGQLLVGMAGQVAVFDVLCH